MIALSPLTRRIVAIALLALAVLVVLSLAEAALSGTIDAVEGLGQARSRSARLDALASRRSPPEAPPLPAQLAFPGATRQAAAAAVGMRIRATAARAQLGPPSLALPPEDPTNPNLIRIELALEGPEMRLLRFVADLERDAPAVRLRTWRISRLDAPTPGLRLEATAVAAWGGRT